MGHKLVKRKVKDLKMHPHQTFDDGATPGFIDSVKRCGIIETIVIDKDNYVISGHRRLQAADMAGLEEVDCDLREDIDSEEMGEALVIHANVWNREITNVERSRLQQRLEELYKSLIDQGLEIDGGAKGRSAEAVGWSRPTARKATDLLEKVEEMEAEGKESEAREVRDDMNRSVHGAHDKHVAPMDRASQQAERRILDHTIDDLVGKIVRALDDRNKLYAGVQGNTGKYMSCQGAMRSFVVAWHRWRDWS